jgi:hypothetical protein
MDLSFASCRRISEKQLLRRASNVDFIVENVITRGCKWNEAVTENVTVCDY